ncbi:MAG: monovalent cation/proton antiporter MnhG/PhaG subunit [Polyangiales bacterium]
MTLALDIIATILIGGGSFFCLVGGIGLLRLRGFYSRCHAAGVTDSAGAAGILVGLCFVSEPLIAFKLLTILVFLWLSSVASTHALVKAAYARGVKLHQPRVKDWTHLAEEETKARPSEATESAPS